MVVRSLSPSWAVTTAHHRTLQTWLPLGPNGESEPAATGLRAYHGSITWTVNGANGQPAVFIPERAMMMLDDPAHGIALADATVFVCVQSVWSGRGGSSTSLLLQQDGSSNPITQLSYSELFRSIPGFPGTLTLYWMGGPAQGSADIGVWGGPMNDQNDTPPAITTVGYQLKPDGSYTIIDARGGVRTGSTGVLTRDPMPADSAPLSIGSYWYPPDTTSEDASGTFYYHEIRIYPGTTMTLTEMQAIHGALLTKWGTP